MNTSLGRCLCLVTMFALPAQAQSELRGFEMPMTVSGAAFASHRLSESPDADSNRAVGMRLIAYPTLRISENWFFSGAIQIHSRPYFYEQFGEQGRGNGKATHSSWHQMAGKPWMPLRKKALTWS